MKLYRQGDIYLQQIPSLPRGRRKPRPDGILAEGETTGHKHAVADLSAAELLEIDDGLYLRVGEQGVAIVHDEHKPIALPPGNYKLLRQREYAPTLLPPPEPEPKREASAGWRYVSD